MTQTGVCTLGPVFCPRVTCHKPRIHHSKEKFKYTKYLKLPPSDCWFRSLPLLLLYYIYWWQRTEKTEKPKCQPNKRRTCCHWLHAHLIFRSSEAEQKASVYLKQEAAATTHIYSFWKGQNVQSLPVQHKESPKALETCPFNEKQ